ncbi:MAG: phage tail sheath C-terminal domain-containing protein [Acidobacteriota bacterium]
MGQLVRGAPGLYLKGLPSEPVLPLSAIAGLVGIAERGPLHQPEPIRSWDEYLTVFGNFVHYGFLPHEVFGFFRNGGSRCFVVRVADLTDYSSQNVAGRCPRMALLKSASSSDHKILDVNGDETLRIDAINEGGWGNGLSFEVYPSSQQHMRLTTLTGSAAPGSTIITVAEPFDLDARMKIRLAPPGDIFGGRLATVESVNADGTVTLEHPLDVNLPRNTAVLGQGFKLLVRLDERTEVFDNLSMAPTNLRYVVTVVNAPDESLSYVERQARGYSVMVRVKHIVDPATAQSRFRPVPRLRPASPAVDPNRLSQGGDGFRSSAARFRDNDGGDSIRVVAQGAQPFRTSTTVATVAGADRVVIENVAGLSAGDSLTLNDAALTETYPIVSIGPNRVVVLKTGAGGLVNSYRLGAVVTLETQPFRTSTTLATIAGVDSVVVESIAGLAVGDALTVTDKPLSGKPLTETHPILSIGPDNVVVLNTGVVGLANPYEPGSTVTVAARASEEQPNALGSRGNQVRVRAERFATSTALPTAAGVERIVVENLLGLAVGDALTLTDKLLTETHPIVSVGPGNVVVLSPPAGGLANEFGLGSVVTVADRFTLTVFQDPAGPVTTTTALEAAAGAAEIVVDNIVGVSVGDDLTLTVLATDESETHPIVSLGPDNVVTVETGGIGLRRVYALGSLVTVRSRSALALEPSEVHRNLSADPANPRYFRQRLHQDSTLICGDGPDVVVKPPVGEVMLTGGLDPGQIDFRWYTGYDTDGEYFRPPGQEASRRCGLASLEAVDEVDLVAVSDLAGQTLFPAVDSSGPDALYLVPHRQVLYHAARLGDRLALLDTRAGTTPEVAARLPQQLANPLTSKFGALYYPWLNVTVGVAQRVVPPSGFVAGVVARADAAGGAGRAPANFPLNDVVDLEHQTDRGSVLLEPGDQDALNPAGVNAIRKFERPALEVWGARTLSSDPAARYVNVRRLLIAIKKALARRLLWTVFEPNSPALRQRIQSNLQSVLQTLVAGGATAADDDAFFIKCDDENNPEEASRLGQVVAEIGIALVAPAEFIILNVKRTPDAVNVSEEAS